MRFLKNMLLALLGLILLLVVIGFFLPSGYHVSRGIVIAAPAERIFAQLDAPRQWQHWSEWNRRDPAMQLSYAGPDRGVGAKWSWQSRTEGNGTMTFTHVEPGKQLEYELIFPDIGSHSSGKLTLEEQGGQTKVTWTNDGDMGGNPLMHYFALMMDGLVGPDFDKGLANLKHLSESQH